MCDIYEVCDLAHKVFYRFLVLVDVSQSLDVSLHLIDILGQILKRWKCKQNTLTFNTLRL